jgi:hypothetical protein
MPVVNPKVIGHDTCEFERFTALQNELQSLLHEMQEIATQSVGVGKVENVRNLTLDPAAYLVNLYKDLYLSGKPSHLPAVNFFVNDTGVSLERLNTLKIQFEKVLSKLGNHKPTINAKGMSSGVKFDNFNILLRKDKTEHWEDLQTFLAANKQLCTHQITNYPIFQMRAFSSLYMDKNSELVPDLNIFKQ